MVVKRTKLGIATFSCREQNTSESFAGVKVIPQAFSAFDGQFLVENLI